MPAEQEPTDWQPIETAPRDGSKVLLWLPDPRTLDPVIIGRWSFDSWWTHDDRWMNDHSDESEFDIAPTYWQPLPEPPHAE